jgi:hypothetical protein
MSEFVKETYCTSCKVYHDNNESCDCPTDTQILRTLQVKYDKLQQQADLLADSLRALNNEVKGTLHAHELAIRYDHGNSNWACIDKAMDSAEKSLSDYKNFKGES